MRDPYDVLGVPRSADQAEVKKAFRKLAKAHHPDRNTDDPKAKDRFAEVNQAYEILGDEEKKAQFDRGEIDAEGKPRFTGFEGFGGGRARPGREGAGGGFSGFEFNFGGANPFGGRAQARGAQGASPGDDIFSHLFGEAMRGAGRSRPEPRGEDVEATLTVTLEEVAAEAKTRVALPGGREVDVVLPKGVADGQVIRLRGLGRSVMGAEPGDALLTIRFAPHERFAVEGLNLRQRLPVSLDEAVLGATVRVPTLTGAVEMTIPPMTSSGRTFRLRGKGLPGKDGRGDLFAAVEITLPESDDDLVEYARKRRGARVA